LQSNKTEDAVALFDVIHTVDRAKIATAIKKEMDRQQKNIVCFIQVNLGDEAQKSGISSDQLGGLVKHCREIGLNVAGLMCIPPQGPPPGPYFALLAKLAQQNGFEKLSMGMSADYESAIMLGSTHVRVGSALFGTRPSKA
jgi:hypothetical protein